MVAPARCWEPVHAAGVAVLHPPVSVAVAHSARDVPTGGDWAFEPKLDGWRAVGFAETGLLHSRRGALLATRFPEISAAVAEIGAGAVVDGELVALHEGRLEFTALQGGPQRREREGITAYLVVFDLLATEDRDLRAWPYEQRRDELERLLGPPRPHLQLVEMTTDRDTALEWMDPAFAAAGIEGVMAKPLTSRYAPGARSGWLKIRHRITTEAVVLGVAGPDTLVLGHPTTAGWRASGISLPVPTNLRAELTTALRPDEEHPEPRELPGVAAGLPGTEPITYLPVHPDIVVEIEADTAIEFGRWRHRPHVLRIRPDLHATDL